MKPFCWGVLAGAALVLAFWFFDARAADRKLAIIQEHAVRLARAGEVMDSANAALRRQSAHRAAERDSLVRALHHVAAQLGGRTDTLLDSVLVQAPDTLRPVLKRLEAAIERERKAGARLFLAQDSSIRQDSLDLARAWRAVSQVKAQRDSALTLLQQTLRIAHPHRCGLGLGGGYGISERGLGPTLSVGLVCRL